jgi:hypothetical protein
VCVVEIKKFVVTFRVMRHFFILQGAPRSCVEFCDPTAVSRLNLKAVVEREKAVQAIDVHREFTNCVVTFLVMSQLFHFLGASRGCADFRDPTAVFRLDY